MTIDRFKPTTWPDTIHFSATGIIMVDHLTNEYVEEWDDASPTERLKMWAEYKRLVLEDVEEQLFQAEYTLVLTDDDDNVLRIGFGEGND
jgi:hypothetical protein